MTEVEKFIVAAVQASFYICPTSHGLSHEELLLTCKTAGFHEGEVNDALHSCGIECYGEGKYPYQIGAAPFPGLTDFNFDVQPEKRNRRAFQFIFDLFEEEAKRHGIGRPTLSLDAACVRAESAGFSRLDVEVAITSYLLVGNLKDNDGVLSWERRAPSWPSPDEQIRHHKGRNRSIRHSPELETAYTIVHDVVGRRMDGRAAHPEPYPAFLEVLETLEHARFRSWWMLTYRELMGLSESTAPTSCIVLSAALAEAALSFVVQRAKGHGIMRKIDNAQPRSWRFVDLLAAARQDSGDPSLKILSDELFERGRRLNGLRQRIHAGYLIAEFPTGQIQDVRPEEAREAQDTSERIVRSVLDWLMRNTESDRV